MNKKKVILIAVSCVLAVAVVVGGVFGVLKLRQPPVKVFPMEGLATTESNMGMSTISGNVRADNVQSVYLTQTQTVTELLVSEGQQVSKGDVLLRYDTSLDSLQLQRKDLEIQKLQRDLLHAKEDYNALVGYHYYSLAASFDGLAHLSASISRADISFLTDETAALPTEPVPTDPTDATDPTDTTDPAEPVQPGIQPDGSVVGYALVGGSGTQEEPYLCVVSDGVPMENSFFDSLLGFDESIHILFVQCENNMANGIVTGAWGMQLTRDSDTQKASFVFFDASDYVGDTLENHGKPIDPDDPGGGGGGGGMSYEELQKLKQEKMQQIKECDLQIRLAQVEYKKMEKELGDGAMYAECDGVVKAVGDPETAFINNEPLMKISGGGGYYISGVISELKLDTVAVGQSVTVNSWMSGGMYEGTVDSVSDYPSSSYGWDGGNSNVSFYPFTVFVSDDADLQADEYVDMSLNTGDGSSSLYLEKPFVLQENGKNYVYVQSSDGRLEKRELKVGRMLWGSYIEILSGLTLEDYIAFPYGKNITEGAKTVQSPLDELYNYG